MQLEDINLVNLKNQINLAYMHGENQNQDALDEVNIKIKDILLNNNFISVMESDKLVTIPYGNNNDYVIPIFSDKKEFEKGLEYFRLNEMDENKHPVIVDINRFKKVKSNPNFLGLLINIATVSYIVTPDLI